jgi:hypothetical protein
MREGQVRVAVLAVGPAPLDLGEKTRTAKAAVRATGSLGTFEPLDGELHLRI